MSNQMTRQLSRDLAAEILDRAAAIDAAESHDLTTLRSAAVDAGISAESFDRALAEMVASAPREAPPAVADRGRVYEIALKGALIGVLSGVLAIALVSLALGGPPPADAVAGAAVGGGGALAGALAYLLGKLNR